LIGKQFVTNKQVVLMFKKYTGMCRTIQLDFNSQNKSLKVCLKYFQVIQQGLSLVLVAGD